MAWPSMLAVGGGWLLVLNPHLLCCSCSPPQWNEWQHCVWTNGQLPEVEPELLGSASCYAIGRWVADAALRRGLYWQLRESVVASEALKAVAPCAT